MIVAMVTYRPASQMPGHSLRKALMNFQATLAISGWYLGWVGPKNEQLLRASGGTND